MFPRPIVVIVLKLKKRPWMKDLKEGKNIRSWVNNLYVFELTTLPPSPTR